MIAETHKVKVDGLVSKHLALSTDDLRSKFPQHEVLCALQCAGNRRHTMRTELQEVQGIDWFDGAIMNCKWTGPRLRDVLLAAGIDSDQHEVESGKGLYVAFDCYQVECQEENWYGGSVEMGRCINESDEVILALEVTLMRVTVYKNKRTLY